MTKISRSLEGIILLIGDMVILFFSVWLALFFRHFILPTKLLFFENIGPFFVLIVLTIIVFFISGLYDKQTTFFKDKLPKMLVWAQVINSLIAVGFFYFNPSVGIAPKGVLFIYLVISFILIYLWRLYGMVLIDKKAKETAILIGDGKEYDECFQEVNSNSDRYGFTILRRFSVATMTDAEVLIHSLKTDSSRLVILDMHNKNLDPILSDLYACINKGILLINFYDFYEEIFDRIPLDALDHTWALRHASRNMRKIYDISKRIIDIVIAVGVGGVSLLLYPFVMIAIKLDDNGPIFITQERIGKYNKVVRFYKFRTMKNSDNGRWQTDLYESVTRVGYFLRKSRIDELPQLWSVIIGDLSLIGPRPDIVDLGADLVKNVPYYSIRTVIKPGLSGWAQIKQDVPPHSIEETKVRLSYDLYYIKNRSFVLDVTIILKTIKTLLLQSGR